MTRITYKGLDLTRTKVTNRIIKTFLDASDKDKFDWYKDAHNYAKYLACTFDVSVIVSSGIIAALSPVKEWNQNKNLAYKFLKTGGNCGGHMKQFLEKARLILETAVTEKDVLVILNGRKISSFFINILRPDDSNNVTIDRHALTVATGIVTTDKFYSGMTKIQYDFFVNCYKKAAEKMNVSALLMQSATWEYYRNNKQLWKK